MEQVIGERPDWAQLIEWDRKYYMRTKSAADEYVAKPVQGTDGVYMTDGTGQRILDMHNGTSVNAGHGNRYIIDTIKQALDRHDFVWETYLTDYRAAVCKLLVEDIMGPDDWAGRARFVSSGSEAVEEALMVAKTYTQRRNIISLKWSYHGWTTAAGSCNGTRNSQNLLVSPKDKTILEVPGFPLPDVHMVHTPDPYRCPYGADCNDCDGAALEELEQTIRKLGTDSVAAVITDIAYGGLGLVLSRRYVEGVRALTKKYGIVWIDDEVITGFGRTGKWFAYQLYSVKPDIVVLGKGLCSNYIPSGGIVVSRDIAEFFNQYRWTHAATNASHPIMMAAIWASTTYLRDHDIPDKAAKDGDYIRTRLNDLERRHRCVGFVQGIGLLWGIEIVKDKKTKEPFVAADRDFVTNVDTSRWPNNLILRKCLKQGVYLSGIYPNTLRIAPPLTITRPEIDKVLDVLDGALTEFEHEML